VRGVRRGGSALPRIRTATLWVRRMNLEDSSTVMRGTAVEGYLLLARCL
jgi:hypothetical protein